MLPFSAPKDSKLVVIGLGRRSVRMVNMWLWVLLMVAFIFGMLLVQKMRRYSKIMGEFKFLPLLLVVSCFMCATSFSLI